MSANGKKKPNPYAKSLSHGIFKHRIIGDKRKKEQDKVARAQMQKGTRAKLFLIHKNNVVFAAF